MKPKVAFFDFAGCEGCQLQVVNLEESILDLIDIVEVVSFREAMKEHSDDYDIAFIEGSIARPMDEERLRGIRSKAKILVALGACACMGGVNALRNQFPVNDLKKMVYGGADPKHIENNPYFDIFPVKAVDEVVKVDYYIPVVRSTEMSSRGSLQRSSLVRNRYCPTTQCASNARRGGISACSKRGSSVWVP